METMRIYEALKTPPATALKEIKGGRLKGMTDINPMWRIKALTEQFGPCGIGWYYNIVEKWIEQGAEGNATANVIIELFVKYAEEWSKPIIGIGGSSFVSAERNGFYTSDECFKMALTDAISVSCKSLGMAADVYWDKDRTKYDQQSEAAARNKEKSKEDHEANEAMKAETAGKAIDGAKAASLKKLAEMKKVKIEDIEKGYGCKIEELKIPQWTQAMNSLSKR